MISFPADVIENLAGIAPGSPLHAIRDGRMQAREIAQNSFLALFGTAETADMSRDERFAVAAFVSALHGDARAAAFYAGHLPAGLAVAVASEAARGAGRGPYGVYPSAALAAENVSGPGYTVSMENGSMLGGKLGAALEHAHILAFHPRDADASALQKLLDAGWSTTGIVTFSQLVAFLSFQLRAVAGLRALAAAGGGA